MESKDVIEASAEQLSFPNVSIDNREGSEEISSQLCCLSSGGETATDSLRTPPQHSMEQQTQATNDNLSPAPPQPSLPPPVVLTVTETPRLIPEQPTLSQTLLSSAADKSTLVNSVHLKSCVDALIQTVNSPITESTSKVVLTAAMVNNVQNEGLPLTTEQLNSHQLELSPSLPLGPPTKLLPAQPLNCASSMIPTGPESRLDLALPLQPDSLPLKPTASVQLNSGAAGGLFDQVPSMKNGEAHHHSAKHLGELKTTNPSFVKPFETDDHNNVPCLSGLPTAAPVENLAGEMDKETPLSLIKEEKLLNLNSTPSTADLSEMTFMKQEFTNMEYAIKTPVFSSAPTPTVPTATNTFSALPSHSFATHPWKQSPLDAPLSLSTKSAVITSNMNSLPHPSHRGIVRGLVPSSSHSFGQQPPQEQQQQHSYPQPLIAPRALPTSVPVSVVTSVSEYTQRELLRLRQNSGGELHNSFQPQNTSSAPRDSKPIVSSQVTASVVVNSSTSSVSSPSVSKLPSTPLLSGNPAKPFQCGVCGKHLASKNVFQLHLRSHSGEKPFACTLCGNAFSQKTSLTRHMRSHTGERPFPCTVCSKRFADKERIKIHMRTHTGEKPFSCEVCGKQFSQKSTVKRHMSVHTGEKPFRCDHCGKGFANRGNLTAHNKTHLSTT